VSATLLIDNSAWARLWTDSIRAARKGEIAAEFDAGLIAVCLPFLLEAGYSARAFDDHDEFYDRMVAFPYVTVDRQVERRALDAQAQLARAGHHRISPSDLLIAALADVNGLGILHYDKDFDLILEKTELEFRSEWLMPRGSL
jgi:hypothetical protein